MMQRVIAGVGAVLVLALALLAAPTQADAASYIAADHFVRNVSNGWGQATPGGTYTLDGPSSDFWVSTATYARGMGYIRAPRPGATRGAVLGSAKGLNVELHLSTYIDAAGPDGPYYVYAVMRSTGANEIRARIIYNRDCSVSTSGSIVEAGRERALGSPVTVANARWCGAGRTGRTINLRTQVQGTGQTTLRIKAWLADGRAEPSAWLWSASTNSGSIAAAGAVGLRVYASSTAVKGTTFMFYNWTAFTI